MRDALVDGNIIPESGIPDFIAIIDPDDVRNANDLFDNIQNIRTYARNHNEMRAGYIAQYFRWSGKDSFWKTESWSRVFAVWIQWSVVNGRIKGQPIFDRPFARTAREVFQTFCDCLNDLGITAPADLDTNFDIETLRGYLTDDTESVG